MISLTEVTKLNKYFLLLLGLSVFLNVITIVMFAAAFGLIPALGISKPVGITVGGVCIVLASAACFAAVLLNRK